MEVCSTTRQTHPAPESSCTCICFLVFFDGETFESFFSPVDEVRSCRFAVDFHMTSPAQGELCVFILTRGLSDEVFLRILGENKLLPTLKHVVNKLGPACVLIQSRSGCKFYILVPEMAAIISLCCLKPFMWKKSNHTFSRRSHFIYISINMLGELLI